MRLQFENESLKRLAHQQDYEEIQHADHHHYHNLNTVKRVSELLPAVDLVSKTYSLQPDMLSGWKPKKKPVGPVPTNFDNKLIDTIVDDIISNRKNNIYKVIYLGGRPQSSYKLHQQINHEYQYKYADMYSGNGGNLAAFYRKFYSQFHSKKTRPFKGMNPILQSHLNNSEFIFQANYESGNLDTVIKVGQFQYDLFMRIDSNTRGHTQWFNFTIKNGNKKRIKINICNFRKEKTLLQRGMKPYVFSRLMHQSKGENWHQAGNAVRFVREQLRYTKIIQDEGFTDSQSTFYCLKFQYNFQKEDDQVSFAYCPPYTYSRVLNLVSNLHSFNYVKETLFCQSMSGLPIPMLTITDFSIPHHNKKCILLSARIHPGQSNGSFVMEGFLKFICGNSKQAVELRQKSIIKAIPMLNPDGVVAGNFRTSLCGMDLNRVFKGGVMEMLFPEVKLLKQLVIKLKEQFKKNLILFMDFHGHSVKKNVFIYGPEYNLFETNYYKTRIFPKLLSEKTEMFRYYSCSFRIANFKRSTARAVLLKHIPHCYTVQASSGFYYSSKQKKDIEFTAILWEEMGKYVGETMNDYIQLVMEQQRVLIQKKRKLKQLKLLKKKQRKNKLSGYPQQKIINNSNNYYSNHLSIEKYGHKKNRQSRTLNSSVIMSPLNTTINQIKTINSLQNQLNQLPQNLQNLINKIRKDQQLKTNLINLNQADQSDKWSEGGSDSQKSRDDLMTQQIQKLHNGIIQSLQQFKVKFGQKQKKRMIGHAQELSKIYNNNNHTKLYSSNSNKKQQERREKIQKIDMIPSLRKKMLSVSKQNQVKREQQHKNPLQIFNWSRVQQQFLVRTSNLKNTTKYLTKTQLNPLEFNSGFIYDFTSTKNNLLAKHFYL